MALILRLDERFTSMVQHMELGLLELCLLHHYAPCSIAPLVSRAEPHPSPGLIRLVSGPPWHFSRHLWLEGNYLLLLAAHHPPLVLLDVGRQLEWAHPLRVDYTCPRADSLSSTECSSR